MAGGDNKRRSIHLYRPAPGNGGGFETARLFLTQDEIDRKLANGSWFESPADFGVETAISGKPLSPTHSAEIDAKIEAIQFDVGLKDMAKLGEIRAKLMAYANWKRGSGTAPTKADLIVVYNALSTGDMSGFQKGWSMAKIYEHLDKRLEGHGISF